MRSAAAAGAAVIVLGPGSVDAYNPKVVRASAGASSSRSGSWRVVRSGGARTRSARHGRQRLGAAAARRRAVRRGSTSRVPTALVLGHEAHGLGADVAARSTAASRSRWRGRRVAQRRDGRHRAAVRSGPAAPRGAGATELADPARQSRSTTARRAPSVPRADARRRSTDAERDATSARSSPLNEIREAIKTVDGADRPRSGKASRRRAPRARGAGRRRAARSSRPREPRPRRRARPRSTSRSAATGVRRGHLHPVTAVWRELEDVFVGHGLQGRAKVPRSSSTGTTSRRSTSRPATRPGDAGHALREAGRAGGGAAAHAHVAGAGAHDGGAGAADLRGRAGPRVPQRDARRRATRRCSTRSKALAVDRGITLGDLLGTIEAFIHALFGAEHQRPLPPVVLPVHRAVGRVRDVVRVLRRRRLHACARAPAGSSSAAAAWSTPTCSRRVGIDPEEYTGFAFGFGIDRLAHAPLRRRPRSRTLGRRRALPARSSEACRCAHRSPGSVSSRRRGAGRRHRRRAEPARPRSRGHRRARPRDQRASSSRAILDVVPHPNADRISPRRRRLRRRADRASCAARRTSKPGMVVPFAPVGATLPGDFKIERRKIRGQSCREGMLCSATELGLGDDHAGILELAADAPLGTDVREVLGLDDVVFDLVDHAEPSRRDGHRRRRPRARRALRAAASPFRSRSRAPTPSSRDDITVVVEAPDRCPRSSVGSRRVTMGASPDWMQRRLVLAGMRPISNVVDVTNYVMLERCRPLHAFDLGRLAGRGIVVRLADDGREDDDARRRRARAHRRGSPDLRRRARAAGHRRDHGRRRRRRCPTPPPRSCSSRRTSSATGIARTSKRLGLRSRGERALRARHRSRHGRRARRRAMELLVEVAGAQVAAGAIDVYPGRSSGRASRCAPSA